MVINEAIGFDFPEEYEVRLRDSSKAYLSKGYFSAITFIEQPIDSNEITSKKELIRKYKGIYKEASKSLAATSRKKRFVKIGELRGMLTTISFPLRNQKTYITSFIIVADRHLYSFSYMSLTDSALFDKLFQSIYFKQEFTSEDQYWK